MDLRFISEFWESHPYVPVVAILIYLAGFVIFMFSQGGSSGKDPFAKDYRRAKEPFVHDQKERDAVLKQRFKPSKIPESVDVVVIGSGIGGLSTAVLLGRAGKKVVVLEQHDQAGGCCHTFVEKGFEFDTGIHYIGKMQDGTHNRSLLDQITCDQLQWARMDDSFDTVVLDQEGGKGDSKWYPMSSGGDEYRENLIKMFPEEREAICKYMELIQDASESFMGFMLIKALPLLLVKILVYSGLYKLVCGCYRKGYVSRSLQEVLDSLTDNADLKVVLSYICGDYGLAPKAVPFVVHSLLINHYQDGAYYPKGGPSEIVFQTVRAIEQTGGKVLVQAPVNRIVCDGNGKAIGVEVGGKYPAEIFAPCVVSDAGLHNTVRRLLPEPVAKQSYLYPLSVQMEPSVSFITGFYGLEGSPSDLNLTARNFWIYNTKDINKSMAGFFQTDKEDIEDMKIPFAYISFPGAKDPEWEKKHQDKSSVIIITLCKYSWFEEWKAEKVRGRGERYEAIKETIGRQLWQICVEHFPHLDGKLVYTEVGTPVTNQFYMGFEQGEIYGLDMGHNRFTPEVAMKLRPKTDIPGLYLTGQDTLTCGFTAALMSGIFTCSDVLGRNVYGDFEKMHKRMLAGADHKGDGLKEKEA